MDFIPILKCAAVLSLVIVLEMAWVIAARRLNGIPGEIVSLGIYIVMITIAVYIILVSFIAAKVMVPIFYKL